MRSSNESVKHYYQNFSIQTHPQVILTWAFQIFRCCSMKTQQMFCILHKEDMLTHLSRGGKCTCITPGPPKLKHSFDYLYLCFCYCDMSKCPQWKRSIASLQPSTVCTNGWCHNMSCTPSVAYPTVLNWCQRFQWWWFPSFQMSPNCIRAVGTS